MAPVDYENKFEVAVFSFGFKYGTPADATMVLDVRFLPNPYWEESMRPRTGFDAEVAAYVVDSDGGREFLKLLVPMLSFLIATNRQAGKSGMRLGIGCTGGHHRSVAVVEKLRNLLRDSAIDLRISHRDVDRE